MPVRPHQPDFAIGGAQRRADRAGGVDPAEQVNAQRRGGDPAQRPPSSPAAPPSVLRAMLPPAPAPPPVPADRVLRHQEPHRLAGHLQVLHGGGMPLGVIRLDQPGAAPAAQHERDLPGGVLRVLDP